MMNLKKDFCLIKARRYLGKTIPSFLFLILFFPVCAQNGEMVHLRNLQSDSIKIRKSSIFELHKLGKKAIPFLIQKIQEDEEIILLLNNPLSSTISAGTLKNYSGVLAAYVIELILGRKELAEENYFGNDFILGTNVKNYIYYNGKIVNEKNENIKKTDLMGIRETYEKWWKENKHKPIEELRVEWKVNRKPLTGSKYHWE